MTIVPSHKLMWRIFWASWIYRIDFLASLNWIYTCFDVGGIPRSECIRRTSQTLETFHEWIRAGGAELIQGIMNGFFNSINISSNLWLEWLERQNRIENWKFMDEMSAPDHFDMKRALIPPFLIVNEKNPMFNTKKLTSDSFDANYSIHWNLIDSNMKVHNTNLRSLRERVYI